MVQHGRRRVCPPVQGGALRRQPARGLRVYIGGGRKRGGGKAAPGYDPGLILPTANGKSWNYNRIMDLWKKRRYSRAQILAAMRAGLISQEEAEEILATVQESMIEPDTADGMTDGSLELGAAEELESA